MVNAKYILWVTIYIFRKFICHIRAPVCHFIYNLTQMSSAKDVIQWTNRCWIDSMISLLIYVMYVHVPFNIGLENMNFVHVSIEKWNKWTK